MPTLDLNNPNLTDIRYKHFFFKSGENYFKLEQSLPYDSIDVNLSFNNDGKLIKLFMATDAIRRSNPDIKINLNLPYFPGSRDDRVMENGCPLSLGVYASLINSQNYNSVHVLDAHSDVTAALVNRIVGHNNYGFVNECFLNLFRASRTIPQNAVFVSPDAGSNKKIFGLSKHCGGVPIIRADKLRDVSTGKILETVVYSDNLTGKICLIVDDICSGGRTFIELAKKLKEKGAEKIYLIVLHHEGVCDNRLLKEAGIDKVFCTNSICDLVQDDFTVQFSAYDFLK